MATRADDLPAETREALLLMAVADRPDLALRVPNIDVAALAPAERAGLVEVDAAGPHFRHPLVRSAVYHAVPFAERARAHRLLFEAMPDQPDRAAWHLAAATLEPDERVASLLEEHAAQTQRRGGAAAAARALERAAELTPSRVNRGRRLLAAAGLAQSAGQADWVVALGTEVLELTSDPELRLVARLLVGWALVWSEHGGVALDTLLPVAEEAAVERPEVAWQALSLAATVAYQHGAEGELAAVRQTLKRLPNVAALPSGDDSSSAAEARVWVQACTVEPASRPAVVAELRALFLRDGDASAVVGAAAWLLDESETAVRLLRQYLARERSPETRGASGATLSALQWACIDTGRWDESLAASRDAREAADAYAMATVGASADLAEAYVLAARGAPDETGRLVTRALTHTDGTDYRSVTARAWHALGTAAAGAGRVDDAYRELARLFDEDGTPMHRHVSYLGLADLAAAAARAGLADPVRSRLDQAVAVADRTSPRLRQIACRARGLLDPRRAEEHFAAGLSDSVGEEWAFERALLRLDNGELLRRHRQINQAKPLLWEALTTLRRLGAEPWARRAEAELRAAGVAVVSIGVDPLRVLTAQQREIVLLAGKGLTNAEIADRLFLSPRTVASHLYRSYPKLGVAGRHQLREIAEPSKSEG